MAYKTELQRAASKANWHKLQVKGAIANLKNISNSFRIGTYEHDRCMSTLTKLEELLLKQVTKDYEELKALITSKK